MTVTSLLGRLVIDTAIAAFILETIVRHGEPAQVRPVSLGHSSSRPIPGLRNL